MSRNSRVPDLSNLKEGDLAKLKEEGGSEKRMAATLPGGLIRPVTFSEQRSRSGESDRRRSFSKDLGEFLLDKPENDTPDVEMPAWPTKEEWNAFEPIHLKWEELMCGFPKELEGTCYQVVRNLCTTKVVNGGWNVPENVISTTAATYRGLDGTDEQNAKAALLAGLEIALKDPKPLESPIKEPRNAQALGLQNADGSVRNFNPARLPYEVHLNNSKYMETGKIRGLGDGKYWPKIERIDMKVEVVGYSRQTQYKWGEETDYGPKSEDWIKDRPKGEPLRLKGYSKTDKTMGQWVKNPNYGVEYEVDPALKWGVVHFYGTRRFTTNFQEVVEGIQGKGGRRRLYQPKVRTYVFHFSMPMQALIQAELHFDTNQEDILPPDYVYPPGMCPRHESEAQKKAREKARKEIEKERSEVRDMCKLLKDQGKV